jgi:hypothetical protein
LRAVLPRARSPGGRVWGCRWTSWRCSSACWPGILLGGDKAAEPSRRPPPAHHPRWWRTSGTMRPMTIVGWPGWNSGRMGGPAGLHAGDGASAQGGVRVQVTRQGYQRLGREAQADFQKARQLDPGSDK